MNDIKLTETQQKHYDSIIWLLFGPRKVGKTTVLIKAITDHAKNNINKKIFIPMIDNIFPDDTSKQVHYMMDGYYYEYFSMQRLLVCKGRKKDTVCVVGYTCLRCGKKGQTCVGEGEVKQTLCPRCEKIVNKEVDEENTKLSD